MPPVTRVFVVSFVLSLLVWMAGARPALGAWPDGWLFLRAEEGWFFYKEPPAPPRQEMPPEAQALPDDLPPPPQAEHEPMPTSTATPLTDNLRVAPVSGPRMEAWLLAVSDRDLERLMATAPAGAIRAWIPVLLDQALTALDRTAVRKYLLVQRESLRRSERFSQLWQEVVWTDPSFDRPDHLPTGALAQAIYTQDKSSHRDARLAALRARLSLLVVVGPDCAACDAQWTIAQSWSAASGFTVRPIAKELVTLGDSTLALPYPGVIDQLAVTQLPSLYLVEPVSGSLTRLGSGLLSEDEIVTRVLQLVPIVPPDNLQPKGELPHVSLSALPPPRTTTQTHDE